MWTELLGRLDAFARQNTFVSLIIMGALGSLLYAIVKQLIYYSATRASRYANSRAKKSIAYLVQHNRDELEIVERMRDRSVNALYGLIETLYHNLALAVILIFLYLILTRLLDEGFLIFLGTGALASTKVIYRVVYTAMLFEKAEKFESYQEKKLARIAKLEGRLAEMEGT